MALSTLVPSPPSAFPRGRRNCPRELLHEAAVAKVPIRVLQQGGFARAQPLPLEVAIASTSKQPDGKAVYHVAVTSRATHKSWVVSYRHTQFVILQNHINFLATCRSRSCMSSCLAVRRMLQAFMPQAHVFMAGTPWVVKDRQAKLENVLRYLLASVVLPGSAMACSIAKNGLPKLVFKFLDVHDDVDKRPLVHKYLESSLVRVTNQEPQDSSAQASTVEELQCAICMDEQDSTEAVALACGHRFHRACISQWLEKQLHCPMCRLRIAPIDIVVVYCRPDEDDCLQWWMVRADVARRLARDV